MKKSILFMKRAAAGLAVSAVCATSALAAVPAEAETAMADGLTDVQKFGVAALLIVIGIAVYKYMKRAV
ncbi:major capsid protein [Aeromonas rivuli]|uniref:major capsid protein n=1 Tax=Aeromonas rivuli TaxID=648794 RepID=UPI0006940FF7|nr:major capsid protein [Aeromonas rivuli]